MTARRGRRPGARRRVLVRACVVVLTCAGLGSAAVADASAAPGSFTSHLGATPEGAMVSRGPWTGLNVLRADGSFGVEVPAGSGVGSTWTATLPLPTGLTIAAGTAQRSFEAPVSSDTAQSNVVTSWDAHGYPHTGCVASPWGCGYVGESGSGPVSVGAVSGPLRLTASCVAFGAGGGTCTPGARWTTSRVELVLRDAVAPTGAIAAGDPLSGGAWQTTSSAVLPVSASDTGAGVYRVLFREGGTTTNVALDPTAVTCRDLRPAAGDAYEFAATAATLAPCPTAPASYAPEFDLVALGDGVHVGDFALEDASGRETVLAHGATVRVNAPGGTLPDRGTPCTNGEHDAAGVCVQRAPSSASGPHLSGGVDLGSSLIADPGVWNDAVGATFAYGWERCAADGSDCRAIAGASGTALSITDDLAGGRLQVVVTVTTAGGSTTSRSALSPVVPQPGRRGSGGAGGVHDVPLETAPARTRPATSGLQWFETTTGDLPVPDASGSASRSERNGRGPGMVPVRLTAALEGGTRPHRIHADTWIAGRLSGADGQPIGGAQVDVVVHAARPGARGAIAGAALTRDDGTFRFRAPPGPSRIYSFGYRERLSDTTYAGLVHVLVAVRPLITLGVGGSGTPGPVGSGRPPSGAARRVAAGRTVRLTGSAVGPARGSRAAVELQMRRGGRWTPFATTRLSRGRFQYRHRFERPTRTTTYAVRAVLPRDPRAPFERAISRTVAVTVLVTPSKEAR